VTVSWTAPASDGGHPLTGYTVSRSGGTPVTLGSGATSQVWSGLSPGSEYAFTVAATNAVGTGGPAITNASTPDVPTAPTGVTAFLDAGDATIDWSPPGSDGGSALTGYEVAIDSGPWSPVGPDVATHTFTGLAGSAHDLAVRAVNAVGPGESVTRSTSTPTTAAPSAPTDLVGSYLPDTTAVLVTWSPPADDGGSAVTSYDVSVDGDLLGSIAGHATGVEITGLPGGQSYEVGVRAVNDVGPGPFALVSVTVPAPPPPTRPSAARIGTASSGARGGAVTATAKWKPPASNGGTPITGYQVFAYQLSSTGRVVRTLKSPVFGAAVRAVTAQLAKGSWRFAVRARNAVGYGPLSAKSNIVKAR
jgi:predicted phage tail protein